MVRRWVGPGMLEAERSFRRVKGYKHMPMLIAAVRKEVASRLTADERAQLGGTGTPAEYDQAVA